MDDYFAYERPLDFVTAAERKRLLKEAGGDEAKANAIMLSREGESSTPSSGSSNAVIEKIAPTAKATSPADKNMRSEEIESSSPPPKDESVDLSSSSGDDPDLDALGMDDL